MHLGLRVRDLRHERHLSQRQLALRVSCHPTMISHIERGQRVPSETLAHLLDMVLHGRGEVSRLAARERQFCPCLHHPTSVLGRRRRVKAAMSVAVRSRNSHRLRSGLSAGKFHRDSRGGR